MPFVDNVKGDLGIKKVSRSRRVGHTHTLRETKGAYRAALLSEGELLRQLGRN
jgi:hypothetical protein